MSSQKRSSELRLDECGENDDVGKVVARGRIEYSATGHELEGRVVTCSVYEIVRKVRLLVRAHTNDREHQLATVSQSDVHMIA